MSKKNNPKSRVIKRKKKSRKKFLFILTIFLIAFFSLIGYGIHLFTKAGTMISESYVNHGREKSELRDKVVNPALDNVSILIMGIDASEKRNNFEGARTDTLMLATLNKEAKSVKLLSIPRDSYVYIPKVERYSKINHAHAYGGTEATIETVEHLLNIPVDYYVKLNFEAFIEVVDALNGITVEVPYELYEQDSKDRANAIHLLPGEQQLNGEEALALARTRKLDNDIERGKRQQEIIKAILAKAMSLGSVFKYGEVIDAIDGNMETNINNEELQGFVSYGLNGLNLNVETYTLEGEDYQPDGIYYWKLDDLALMETKRMLQQHLEVETSSFTESESYQYENAIGD